MLSTDPPLFVRTTCEKIKVDSFFVRNVLCQQDKKNASILQTVFEGDVVMSSQTWLSKLVMVLQFRDEHLFLSGVTEDDAIFQLPLSRRGFVVYESLRQGLRWSNGDGMQGFIPMSKEHANKIAKIYSLYISLSEKDNMFVDALSSIEIERAVLDS